jgi:hypothetical protein
MAVSRGLVLVMLGAAVALAGCDSRSSMSDNLQTLQLNIQRAVTEPAPVDDDSTPGKSRVVPESDEEVAQASDAPASDDPNASPGAAATDNANAAYVQQQQAIAAQQAAQANEQALALANAKPADAGSQGGSQP